MSESIATPEPPRDEAPGMNEQADAEQQAILAEIHAQHDWTMPHDIRYPEWDAVGCPPNCPFRLAIEAGEREIIDGLRRP